MQKINLRKFYAKEKFKLLLLNPHITGKNYALILEKFYPHQEPKFSQKVEYNPIYDLMIIVPAYNVQNYIETCLNSILSQVTQYSFHVIVVNDGSTDHTAEILAGIKNPKLTVYTTDNKGVASARNFALKNIVGKYIMFVDADDCLFPESIEKLMEVAMGQEADLVQGGYMEFYDETFMSGRRVYDSSERIDRKYLYGYAWGKVINASKFKDLCFPEGYEYEDSIMAGLLYPACNKIFRISHVVYGYRKNENGLSATSIHKKSALDTFWIAKYVLLERIRRGYELNADDKYSFLKRFRLNWMRLQFLPDHVQKAAFHRMTEMYMKYVYNIKMEPHRDVKQLTLTIERDDYNAFSFLMNHWSDLVKE